MSIDQILINEISQNVPDKDIALLLSGGVDNIRVGFAANKCNKNITAYSFQTDLHESYDFEKAKEVAKIMGWKFIGITINTSNLKEDFFKLLFNHNCKKKTHFECIYPFLYIYPEIKEKYVLSGWGADGYYGVSKKAHLKYKVKQSKTQFDAFRDDYFRKENCAGNEVHLLLASHWKKKFIAPYLRKSIKQFFYQYDWQKLNKPYQKHHVREAFKKEFSIIGKVKKHINLQLGAEINKLFENLIDDEEVNFKNRSRVMDFCKDWYTKKGQNELFFDM